MAARRNVYLDTSLMELYLYPESSSMSCSRWLLLFPDEVLFGSDAFPFNDANGAEESYWPALRTARISLTTALAEIIASHEVTEARTIAFAYAYLHDAAAKLH